MASDGTSLQSFGNDQGDMFSFATMIPLAVHVKKMLERPKEFIVIVASEAGTPGWGEGIAGAPLPYAERRADQDKKDNETDVEIDMPKNTRQMLDDATEMAMGRKCESIEKELAACYGVWQGGDFIKRGNQVSRQMSDCIPEVGTAMAACVQETGQQRLFSGNVTADDLPNIISQERVQQFADVPVLPNIIPQERVQRVANVPVPAP